MNQPNFLNNLPEKWAIQFTDAEIGDFFNENSARKDQSKYNPDPSLYMHWPAFTEERGKGANLYHTNESVKEGYTLITFDDFLFAQM
jgi:hypothetical protein